MRTGWEWSVIFHTLLLYHLPSSDASQWHRLSLLSNPTSFPSWILPLLWWYCFSSGYLTLVNKHTVRSLSVPGSIRGSWDREKLDLVPSFHEDSGLWLLHHLQSFRKTRTSFTSVASFLLSVTPLASFCSFLSLPQWHAFLSSSPLLPQPHFPPVPLLPPVCSVITASLMALKHSSSPAQSLPIAWHSGSLQTLGALETLSGYLQGQNYFHNSAKMLFVIAKQQWAKLLVPSRESREWH